MNDWDEYYILFQSPLDYQFMLTYIHKYTQSIFVERKFKETDVTDKDGY